MKINIKILLSLALTLISLSVNAQVVSLDPYLQKASVGLVDEFMSRFNGETFHPDIKDDDPEKLFHNIMSLFDIAIIGNDNSDEYHKAEKMAKAAIINNTKLHYNDTTWFAFASCVGSLDGKNVEFYLCLTVEHRKDDMYKWVISKVDGDLFQSSGDTTPGRAMIGPDSHETNFMELSRMTSEQPKNVLSFFRKNFEYDNASTFAYLVYNDKLKIHSVKSLEFVFTQIPGYIFYIKDIAREHNNSGWLINFFIDTHPESTQHLLERIHGCKSNHIDSLPTNKTIAPVANRTNDSVIANILLNYKIRTIQRMGQVNDYLSYIKNTNDKKTCQYYIKELQQLFSSDAKVILSHGSISLDQFCNQLAKGSFNDIEIFAITVPSINAEQISDITTSNRLKTDSHVQKFMDWTTVSDNKLGQQLEIYRELTPNGYEWLPVFGDIYITINE